MAILKMIGVCHPTSSGKYSSLKKNIDYILNEKKTANRLFTASQNCTVDDAFHDFVNTKSFYGHTSNWEHDRQSYHWTISFSPEEHVDYGVALKIAQEFCDKSLSNYECVMAAHTDKAHTHVHIVFNSTSLDGKKFRYDDGEWARIYQPLLDNICKNHNLHSLEEDTGITNEEYYNENINRARSRRKKRRNENDDFTKYKKNNTTYYNESHEQYNNSDFVKKDIDDAILSSENIEEFFMLLKKWGYHIRRGTSEKYGEYFAIKGKGMAKARRNYKLGKDYSIEAIAARIEMKKRPLPEYYIEDFRAYIVNYVYWRKPNYASLSPTQRAYNYMIYHTGIDKNKRKNYYELKQHLKEIEELSDELDIINKYSISNIDDAKKVLAEFEQEQSDNKLKISVFYQDKAPYKDLVKTYDRKKALEQEFYMYKNGNSEYEESYKEYLQLDDRLKNYGFTDEDIEKYKENIEDKYKDLKSEKKQINKKIKLVNQLIDRINNEDFINLSLEEYNSIAEPKVKYYEPSEEVKDMTGLKEITINNKLVVSENASVYKTRVPGTWGDNIRYMVIRKADTKVIDNDKTILTFINPKEQVILYDKDGKIAERVNTEELYSKYYDKVNRNISYKR